MIIPKGPTDVRRSRAPVILPVLFRRASLPIVTSFSPQTFCFTDALHGLSRALQDLNRLDEAIAVSKQISEIDPDDILAHTSLSILYQKKGMVPEAEGNKARVLGWKQQLKKGSG